MKHLEIRTVNRDPGFVAGGFFRFRGYRFVLSLLQKRLPSDIGRIAPGWDGVKLLKPINGFYLNVGTQRSQLIEFQW